MLDLKPVTPEARPQIQPFLDEWAIEHSDSSFGSLCIWQEGYDIRYDIADDALFLHSRDGDKPPILRPPFTRKKGEGMAKALETAEAYFAEIGAEVLYGSVAQAHKDAMEAVFPGKYVFEFKPDFFDYVYNSSDLILLSGGRYHAKRNHISAFRSANADNFAYERYNKGVHCKECIQMYELWLSGKDQDSYGLEQERLAVVQALLNADELGLVGGVIRVFGKVEAFTFGERIGDMAIIHVEKANGEIRGLYPFINQQFVENEFYDVRWINREEDMGEPGLRKAKESYRPARMVEKMSARLAADPFYNQANLARIHESMNDTKPNIVKTMAELEDMENEVEEALLQIEAEEKAGTSSFTPMEEVFAEIDRIIEEAKASET